MSKDLIIGVHSIAAALANPRRTDKKLHATKDGLARLGGKVSCPVDILDSHHFNERSKSLYAKFGSRWERIPGGLLLEAAALERRGVAALHEQMEKGAVGKILCLDQVTDIHNAAAILRSCAFFAVPFVVLERTGNFRPTPAFHRLAAGAVEHVSVLTVSSLPRALRKLGERGAALVGLSEGGEGDLRRLPRKFPSCLVLGAEGKGLSHAVKRCLDHCAALRPAGPIGSLNVSVAAALAMETFWGARKA